MVKRRKRKDNFAKTIKKLVPLINKNYKLEKEDLGEKMFRYKLVRQYKPKPIKDDEYCEICGHYLGDD